MSPTSFLIAPPRGIFSRFSSTAGSGIRTRTRKPPKDFKSLASACSAIPAYAFRFLGPCLERETGFEPATPALARQCSTAELFPRKRPIIAVCRNRFKLRDLRPPNAMSCCVRRAGLEPARPKALAPKASASANSATLASPEETVQGDRRRFKRPTAQRSAAGDRRSLFAIAARSSSRVALVSRRRAYGQQLL